MPTPRGRRLPHPVRVGGPDLWYQMALVDTMVEQSLVSSAEGTRGRECVQGVAWLDRKGERGWLCSPIVHVPFGGSTEGARRSLCQASHQGGSSSVSILLVAERIVCAIVAAPTATPASVRVDNKCPALPVDCRAG